MIRLPLLQGSITPTTNPNTKTKNKNNNDDDDVVDLVYGRDKDRTIADVAYFWTVLTGKSTKGHQHPIVNQYLQTLARKSKNQNQNQNQSNLSNITFFLGAAGVLGGRDGNPRKNVKHLMGTKIVVATQRSLWEDHWRLMEALAAGCLVLTDPMLLLPHSLVDGVSGVVVFHSLDDLRTKLMYYTSIRTTNTNA